MKPLWIMLVLAGCVDTTGGHRVTYDVAARGVGLPNQTLVTGLGWSVALAKAKLHVGALYLNVRVSDPGATISGTECIQPGASTYTGEELSSLDIDVLSTTPQVFPAPADGTDDEARTGEVWLTGGDINATDDATLIADIAATATKGSQVIPFTAQVTIGANRFVPSSDPANPSAHPICKERIVAPIAIDLRPRQGQQLLVTIDPTLWFANVDFATLPQVSQSPAKYAIPDDDSLPASVNFFDGVRAYGNFTFEVP